VLNIVLVHVNTCETYERTVSQEYIDGQEQMRNLIDDPKSLYLTLLE